MPDELDSLVPEKRRDEKDVRLAYYRAIIERYREYIDSSEQKTIPELKALLSRDEDVARIANDFKRELGAYAYARDFPVYAQASFSFVRSLDSVKSEIGVSFWLRPKEMLALHAADSFDKAVFLCALLLSGGSESARVRVLEIEGGVRHPIVLCAFNGEEWLFDATQDWEQARKGALAALLQEFSLSGKRVVRSLYEFNSDEYRDLEE